MFVALILRSGKMHAISYRMGNGSFRTYCSKTFSRKKRFNTVAFDNVCPGLCPECGGSIKKRYKTLLDEEPRQAHNQVQYKYYDMVNRHRKNWDGPKANHDGFEERWWPKFNRFKRLVARK